MVEIPVTLRISKRMQEALTERAAERGEDLGQYVSEIVERTTPARLILEEISGPVYQRFLESGMTEDELSEILEKEKHDMRAERRARKKS
jgi:hypothetical protein